MLPVVAVFSSFFPESIKGFFIKELGGLSPLRDLSPKE
jgi:hypothetical protein